MITCLIGEPGAPGCATYTTLQRLSWKTLAHSTGFQVIETFHSDGEGGILGLYQLWKPLP
jgi:hypothetical protein